MDDALIFSFFLFVRDMSTNDDQEKWWVVIQERIRIIVDKLEEQSKQTNWLLSSNVSTEVVLESEEEAHFIGELTGSFYYKIDDYDHHLTGYRLSAPRDSVDRTRIKQQINAIFNQMLLWKDFAISIQTKNVISITSSPCSKHEHAMVFAILRAYTDRSIIKASHCGESAFVHFYGQTTERGRLIARQVCPLIK